MKRRWMSPSATPATQSAAASPATNQSQPSTLSATPATGNEGKCRQVPRLPRAMSPPSATSARQSAAASPATNPAPKAPSEPARCPKCHACDTKEGGCHQVPCVPRKVPRRHRRPIPPQVRHQSRPSALSATSATHNEGGCRQVPILPRETKVYVTKFHACYAKCRGVAGVQSRFKRATRYSPCNDSVI